MPERDTLTAGVNFLRHGGCDAAGEGNGHTDSNANHGVDRLRLRVPDGALAWLHHLDSPFLTCSTAA